LQGWCVTRRKHRSRPVFFSQKAVTPRPAPQVGGTSLIGAANLSPVTNLVAGTGPEYSGRYKLSRSQKFVKVQDFNCGQMSVSGCKNHYKFVLRAGAKAKSVTTCPASAGNNLPILSVLGAGVIIKCQFGNCFS